LASELHPAPAPDLLPAERTCDACGYEVVEFRPLPHCPMCGALPGAVWPHGVLVAASAA
jgi:rubrerythrin